MGTHVCHVSAVLMNKRANFSFSTTQHTPSSTQWNGNCQKSDKLRLLAHVINLVQHRHYWPVFILIPRYTLIIKELEDVTLLCQLQATQSTMALVSDLRNVSGRGTPLRRTLRKWKWKAKRLCERRSLSEWKLSLLRWPFCCFLQPGYIEGDTSMPTIHRCEE